MIEYSYGIGPLNEKIRAEFHIPFSMVISPCVNSSKKIENFDPKNIPRCHKCEAYINKFSTINSDTWKCPLCGTENQLSEKLPFELEETIEFNLNTQNNSQLFVFIFSLNLHPSDFSIIKTLFTDFISKIKTGKFLFIFHNKDGFYFLTPTISLFDVSENKLKKQENVKLNLLPATLSQYMKSEYLDITSHIFDASQLGSAVLTIMKMQSTVGDQDPATVLSLIRITSSKLPHEQLRFVQIVPHCTPDSLDIQDIRERDIRIDTLTAIYDNAAFVYATQVPGFVIPFNKSNFVSKLNWIYSKHVDFKCFMNVRSSDCECSWNRLRWHYSLIENSLLYIPDVVADQPFVLDIKSTGLNPIIQITAKTTNTFVIFTKKLTLSSENQQILDSINVSVAEWLWVSRSIGIEDASKAITMAAMPVYEKMTKEKEKKDLEKFIRIVPFLNAMNGNSLTAASLIVATPPRNLHLAPKFDGEFDEMTITLFDQVYTAGSPKTGDNIATELGICMPPKKGIPGWLLDFME
ncbi:Sec23/Sec24 zinc finger family protein [Trichomonas vaginalis G3]|uniref:Sec23/Sec24 zinc finger family protein n=1 Tax=Trichomonas vaginalis (strain ATCC PRA-98 / G3) TaxID=412133 RepID=A2ETT0_TRIV3|nr:SEC24-related protein family [Trichomonas vaginalis G3]EAY03961.1 Sec23/Sec24 zinc finger family protein [Trichomonas vaginalis G3]KAI5541020.1 SEC24-related protein family [Trichomonas vaginalis G3]|eukprot:XP_001316184.1 Sec23/Sec24 zinc finger family protein [Trichomonas vaginalis G3]